LTSLHLQVFMFCFFELLRLLTCHSWIIKYKTKYLNDDDCYHTILLDETQLYFKLQWKCHTHETYSYVKCKLIMSCCYNYYTYLCFF
jgi:hypothetical protein